MAEKSYLRRLMEEAPRETRLVYGQPQTYVVVHEKHLQTAIMNDENATGTARWSKCPNCGNAFNAALPDYKGDGTVWYSRVSCSKKCFDEYLEYLNNPGGFA